MGDPIAFLQVRRINPDRKATPKKPEAIAPGFRFRAFAGALQASVLRRAPVNFDQLQVRVVPFERGERNAQFEHPGAGLAV